MRWRANKCRLILQEEQKVERLRLKLEELGVDVDGLLEGIGNDDEINNGDTDGKD